MDVPEEPRRTALSGSALAEFGVVFGWAWWHATKRMFHAPLSLETGLSILMLTFRLFNFCALQQ